MRAILKEVEDTLGPEEAKYLRNAVTTDKQETALHIAARNRYLEACKMLVEECHLRADDKNADGKFPHQLAEEAKKGIKSGSGRGRVSRYLERLCRNCLLTMGEDASSETQAP